MISLETSVDTIRIVLEGDTFVNNLSKNFGING